MRHTLPIFIAITMIAFTANGQKLQLAKSKPIFQPGEWVMDISEIKIYDDDLLFGRIRFKGNKSALDTIELKIANDEGPMSSRNFHSIMGDDHTVSEVGDGIVDFYLTKFKRKYTRDFLYFVSSADGVTYLTLIIDIEQSGTFYPWIFSVEKVRTERGNFEVQLSDTKKQLSDFRLVRVQQ